MKYKCKICGYIYDPAENNGIEFKDLPEDWVCPLCGASKSDFELMSSDEKKKEIKKTKKNREKEEDLEKLSIGQLAALCSNLARGCQKQYKFVEEESFLKLAEYFTSITPEIKDSSIDLLAEKVMEDLNVNYKNVNNIAVENKDRGAQRVTTWGEKVTRIINSLMKKYNEQGESIFANSEVWLCTVCGFIYIGKSAPEKCPVCKVPSSKFEKIEGR